MSLRVLRQREELPVTAGETHRVSKDANARSATAAAPRNDTAAMRPVVLLPNRLVQMEQSFAIIVSCLAPAAEAEVGEW
jgi:hypothetical protein